MRVISGHLGWVRSVAVEPGNKWFATGAGDRVVKIWDLASGELKLSLTGHISTVRGLAVSPRHPYLFSCGEDKVREPNIAHHHLTFQMHADGEVLGSGVEQSHPTLPWPPFRRLCIKVAQYTSPTHSLMCYYSLHPTLDILVTSGRDASARVWDMRTKAMIHVLGGHTGTIADVKCQESDPQVITASMDSTIR